MSLFSSDFAFVSEAALLDASCSVTFSSACVAFADRFASSDTVGENFARITRASANIGFTSRSASVQSASSDRKSSPHETKLMLFASRRGLSLLLMAWADSDQRSALYLSAIAFGIPASRIHWFAISRRKLTLSHCLGFISWPSSVFHSYCSIGISDCTISRASTDSWADSRMRNALAIARRSVACKLAFVGSDTHRSKTLVHARCAMPISLANIGSVNERRWCTSRRSSI